MVWPSSLVTTAANWTAANWIGVGFGTAALGGRGQEIVTWALQEGFRKFDTAEAEYWYDQSAVGRALAHYFEDECSSSSSGTTAAIEGGSGHVCGNVCHAQGLQISTKIPPWSLTSEYDIRRHAASSRQELVGFCEHHHDELTGEALPFPLDVYYIHAPECWEGWHARCDNPPEHLLDLKQAWLAMEAVVGHDKTVRRIGLSNVRPWELRELIAWIQKRQQEASNEQQQGQLAPPRIPDVLQAYADPLHPAKELRAICQQYNIEFVSYSTLGTQHRGSRKNPVLTNWIVQELAVKYQRSTAEIVLQWARQHNMSVIPRSTKLHHIQELARLLSPETSFELEPQDLVRIDSLEDTRA